MLMNGPPKPSIGVVTLSSQRYKSFASFLSGERHVLRRTSSSQNHGRSFRRIILLQKELSHVDSKTCHEACLKASTPAEGRFSQSRSTMSSGRFINASFRTLLPRLNRVGGRSKFRHDSSTGISITLRSIVGSHTVYCIEVFGQQLN
jgi:hypothetical protein